MIQPTAAIYSRVSTEDQDFARQTAELKVYAAAYGLDIKFIFEEKISGKNKERPELNKLSELIQDKKIQHVLVWDLSRLARSTADTLQLINFFTTNQVSLHIKDIALITLDKDLKMSPNSNFMITILAAAYEMERHTIRARLDSGYKHHLKNGGKVGRNIGYEKPIEQIKFFNEVKRELRSGLAIRKTQGVLQSKGKNISLGSIVKVRNHLIQTNQLIA